MRLRRPRSPDEAAPRRARRHRLVRVPKVRARAASRSRRLLENRAITAKLVSVAGLVHRPVLNQAGAEVGRVVDVVARWDAAPYPLVTGLVMRVGRRLAWVPSSQVGKLGHGEVRLRSARLDLADFVRREGEVVLAGDVLDHQLVDVDDVRVVRAGDLYLVQLEDSIRLVGVDVGYRTVLRRVLPGRALAQPRAERVIDWAGVQPFTQPGGAVRLRRANEGIQRLRPSELADVLEELGRAERQQLLGALGPDLAADALEEMEPDAVEAVLREAPVQQAASLIRRMEPDEAVDALRDLPDTTREEILDALPPSAADRLLGLLSFPEGAAGGLMTTSLVLAQPDETVAEVRRRLRTEVEHEAAIDGVIVVDDGRVLVDDVTTYELFVAEDDATIGTLCKPPWPVTVEPNVDLDELVGRFIDARGSSVVVVDAAGHPLGRILADDVVDALASRRRYNLARLWS